MAQQLDVPPILGDTALSLNFVRISATRRNHDSTEWLARRVMNSTYCGSVQGSVAILAGWALLRVPSQCPMFRPGAMAT